jgi:hypothetical protein
LSFLTGYFGMNFRILTADVQTTLWPCPAYRPGSLLAFASTSGYCTARGTRRGAPGSFQET